MPSAPPSPRPPAGPVGVGRGRPVSRTTGGAARRRGGAARRRLVTAALLGLALAACGTPTPTPPAPPAPSAPTPPPGSAAGAAPSGTPTSPDAAFCADYRDRESLLRETVEAVERMPVLPAGVGLLLLGVRQTALVPGVQDPALAAAQVELVAAIDDLDAQGRTLIGPEGDAARDAVQLDAERVLRALTEVERLCGAPAS